MTMSPACNVVFGIARPVLLHISNICKAVSGPINVWTSWLLCPIRAFSHASNEYEASGRFYIRPPSQINKLSIKGMGILKSDTYHPPPARVHQSAFRKIHSSMADLRSSSSRPRSPKPGDWERCSVPHSRLVELQTKGFPPPAYMVPV